ncbi:9293_t:CDS:2, partial [Funneliformis geosporum]
VFIPYFSLDYPIVILGAIAAGGKVTSINSSYTAYEIIHQLQDSGASVIIVIPALLSVAINVVAATNISESNIFLFGEEEINGFQPFSSLMSMQEVNPIEYTPEEAKLTTAYLYYSSIVLDFSDPCPKFELETFCRVIQDYKVNFAPIVPPIALLLVKNPVAKKYDLSSLQWVMCDAAPLSKELINDFDKIYKITIKQAYGMLNRDIFNNSFSSVGILIPNVECKIVSENGQGNQPNFQLKTFSEKTKLKAILLIELGYNEPGELYIRGPNGYLNNKEATDLCIDNDGWFRTGDIGYADLQGIYYLFIRMFR